MWVMSYLQKWQSNKAFRLRSRFSIQNVGKVCWFSWLEIIPSNKLMDRAHLSSTRLYKCPIDFDRLSEYLLAVQFIDRFLCIVVFAELEKRIALERVSWNWVYQWSMAMLLRQTWNFHSPSRSRFFDPDSSASSWSHQNQRTYRTHPPRWLPRARRWRTECNLRQLVDEREDDLEGELVGNQFEIKKHFKDQWLHFSGLYSTDVDGS